MDDFYKEYRGFERRGQTRVPYVATFRVLEWYDGSGTKSQKAKDGQIVGLTKDISQTGLKVQLDWDFPLQTIVRFEMDISRLDEQKLLMRDPNGKKDVTAIARVVRQRWRQESKQYEYGLYFVRINDVLKEVLEAYIRHRLKEEGKSEGYFL